MNQEGIFEMEQSWTVDKYDVPSGDLEFWARRRGLISDAGPRRNASKSLGGSVTSKALPGRFAVAAWLAVAVLIAYNMATHAEPFGALALAAAS